MRFSNIDLHCHSFVSDGSLSPKNVVQRASDNGVTMLSLTDHDTIGGLAEAKLAADECGIRLISGIELSCTWGKHGVHILGYNFPFDSAVIKQAQKIQTDARLKRASQISERLQSKGLPDVLDLALSKSQVGVPGRPHFSEALIEMGVVKDHGEAFKKYLGSGKVGDVKNNWPYLEEVVAWIKDAGGQAVIAHPRKYDFSLTKLRTLIGEFLDCGGEGMEVNVSGQKPGEAGMLADLCTRYGLKGSVGSDFHSPKYSWAELGRIPALPSSVEPIWGAWL